MKLEPVTPDPKKLRTTAWILVAIMIVGGWLVLKAYGIWSAKQNKSPLPAKVWKIEKHRSITLMRQDGSIEDMFVLRGKVVVLNIVSLAQPEKARLAEEEMRRLAAKYADNNGFRLVTLVLDPPAAEQLQQTLSQQAQSRSAALPRWWFAANEAPTLHKFIRNELKPSVPPEKVNGQWVFDSSITLIDRDGNLSRPLIRKVSTETKTVVRTDSLAFDFAAAAEWDAKGLSSGSSLTNVAHMSKLLDTTIDTLLALPAKP